MAELKPCPFCGGEAAFLGTTCTIKCKQCGGAFIATNPVVARMEIAAAWNRRVAIMWLIDANRLYDTAEEKYEENDPYCADRRGLSDPEPDGYCSYGERREE